MVGSRLIIWFLIPDRVNLNKAGQLATLHKQNDVVVTALLDRGQVLDHVLDRRRFFAVHFQNYIATRQAWAGGQPAIVESHRVNFAHLDPGVVATGLESLDAYLVSITSGEELLPVFVTGREIAQLSARGTSWCVRGGKIVVRNATKSRRVVAVPAWAVALAGSAGAGPDEDFQSILVAVPSSTTIDLVP